MGLHTWFYKDKNLYEERLVLGEKLEQHEYGKNYLDDLEYNFLCKKYDELDKINDAGYHDVFRTTKRDPDGSYTTDVIYSKKECDKWLEENSDVVYFSDTVFDSPEIVEEKKIEKLKRLEQFWKEYPNGVIEFG